jgi:hypothetical protein
MGKKPKRRVDRPPPLPAAQPFGDEAPIMLSPESPIAESSPARSTLSRKSVGVAAPAIHKWLTPATLRQQFILTELFQPPLALRGHKQ